ncbi:hypothetical protein FQN60_012052, partial [Etheostoma spectabile]
NGGWAVFVSRTVRTASPHNRGAGLLISYGVLYTIKMIFIHLKLDDQEYTSCPVNLRFLHFFILLFPSNPSFPYSRSGSPAPTPLPFPTQNPSQEQIAQLPDTPTTPIWFQNSQLHQFSYPGSNLHQTTGPLIFLSIVPSHLLLQRLPLGNDFQTTDQSQLSSRRLSPKNPLIPPPACQREISDFSSGHAAPPATRPLILMPFVDTTLTPITILLPTLPSCAPVYRDEQQDHILLPQVLQSTTAAHSTGPYLQCLMGKWLFSALLTRLNPGRENK